MIDPQKMTAYAWASKDEKTGKLSNWEVRADGGDLICMMSHHPDKQDEARILAIRIAACLNSCRGLSQNEIPEVVTKVGRS